MAANKIEHDQHSIMGQPVHCIDEEQLSTAPQTLQLKRLRVMKDATIYSMNVNAHPYLMAQRAQRSRSLMKE